MIRTLVFIAAGLLTMVLGCGVFQRKLLYHPTHDDETHGLAVWQHDGRLIGYVREVASPVNVWLLLHGNGGQARDRIYALPAFSDQDAVFILEYPGYGPRPGSPSMKSINEAAFEAYLLLRARFPQTPLCVVGESLGSGPAAKLAESPQPPAKLVLIVPFDILARVAAHHYPFLPTGLLLWDNWNNISALAGYKGPVEIFGARNDQIIPIEHARALAASIPGARFHEIDGGHNDWAGGGRVLIRNP
jgi:pimeloyl-ACP methyl ester carboxylesterase